jgi:hypothetical protein
MIDKFQPRKPQTDETPANGLARRATDRDLRGMNINEDDSEQAWADFEEALNQPDEPKIAPTQPGDLR